MNDGLGLTSEQRRAGLALVGGRDDLLPLLVDRVGDPAWLCAMRCGLFPGDEAEAPVGKGIVSLDGEEWLRAVCDLPSRAGEAPPAMSAFDPVTRAMQATAGLSARWMPPAGGVLLWRDDNQALAHFAAGLARLGLGAAFACQVRTLPVVVSGRFQWADSAPDDLSRKIAAKQAALGLAGRMLADGVALVWKREAMEPDGFATFWRVVVSEDGTARAEQGGTARMARPRVEVVHKRRVMA
jgi:hypothetical protein